MICSGCAKPLTACEKAVRVGVGSISDGGTFDGTGCATFCRNCGYVVAALVEHATQPGAATVCLDAGAAAVVHGELRAKFSLPPNLDRRSAVQGLLLSVSSQSEPTCADEAAHVAKIVAVAAEPVKVPAFAVVKRSGAEGLEVTVTGQPGFPKHSAHFFWSAWAGVSELKVGERHD